MWHAPRVADRGEGWRRRVEGERSDSTQSENIGGSRETCDGFHGARLRGLRIATPDVERTQSR